MDFFADDQDTNITKLAQELSLKTQAAPAEMWGEETDPTIRTHDSQTAAIKAEEKTEPSAKGEKPLPSFKTRAEIGTYQLQALLPVRLTKTGRTLRTETAVQKSKPGTKPRSGLEPEPREPGTQPESEPEPETEPAPGEPES